MLTTSFAAGGLLPLLLAALVLAALLGQVIAWGTAVNRIHSLGWSRPCIKLCCLALHLAMLAAAARLCGWLAAGGWEELSSLEPPRLPWWAACHLAAGWTVLAASVPGWLRRRAANRPPAQLVANHTQSLDLGGRDLRTLAGGPLCRALLALPGNECLRLDVNEKTLALPDLPPELDGLTIAHLSDLHLTGKIGRRYFQQAVDLANQMQADLAVVTGDVVDRQRCLSWLPETLGRLEARFGVYFVLGNHDARVNVAQLRSVLGQCGLVDMGGCWRLLEVDGCPLLLAGDERPWFRPQGGMPPCPFSLEGRRSFRILLAHTPDRIDWARRQGFHLLLAGHTHGGQVRLPWLGPVLAPSRHGVTFASGVFHLPPTTMHVSRGLSGLHLLRFNCPPELTRLVLVAASRQQAASRAEPARLLEAPGVPG